MARKHIKTPSISVVKKIQIKEATGHQTDTNRKWDVVKCWQECGGKGALLHVKLAAFWESYLATSLKIKTKHTLSPINPTPGNLAQRNKNTNT